MGNEINITSITDLDKIKNKLEKESKYFKKVGLSKLEGDDVSTTKSEYVRLKSELDKGSENIVCRCCGQIVTTIDNNVNRSSMVTTKMEVERIVEEVEKNEGGTVCNACGQHSEYTKHSLKPKHAIQMMYMLCYYRHDPNAEVYQYYTKEDFFPKELMEDDDYKDIFTDWEELSYWHLIAKKPLSNDKVEYEEGYYALTEAGIKFAQREKGIMRHAYTYNGIVEGISAPGVTIEELLEEINLDYDKMMGLFE